MQKTLGLSSLQAVGTQRAEVTDPASNIGLKTAGRWGQSLQEDTEHWAL